jgi:flavin reductase (DIM6/NTAB) family NADH-FMN oxidoreductase RutF/rubredoxin
MSEMNFDYLFKITYGLYVISTKNGNKMNGFISNTVSQVTADPAQIAVTCSKNNFTAGMISESKILSISVLIKETSSAIIGTFGYHSGKDIDKFSGVNYKIGKTGAPILTDDTLAWIECTVEQTFDVGTHIIFIAKIVDGEILDNSKEPLTYAYYREIKKGKAPKNAPTYINPEILEHKQQSVTTEKYKCSVCGYIYDPDNGDDANDIHPGIAFADLPDNYVCPLCGADKSFFTITED